ncbi:MAG TPA: D-alanine--D-alanine ligase family protein [Tetrasphaera sp.]|uniref:D-alanine--D-alanine ligase family protein n=1 Tax=Nostocoides sp. TaxID=1917966 RepID=UPI002B555BCC|nr:D-alanine--D-alanine ligase family protein [Tetrasphaera sp.]HNQ08428.1 D-alanine--D-alanine ligase family protein [Tetrasphaera sp.]
MSAMDNAQSKIRVALLFGGRSSEHAVSCATAGGVLRAIDRRRYDVLPIGIAPDGRWVLLPDDPEPLELRRGHVPAVPESAPGVVVPTSTRERGLRVLDRGEMPQELGDVDVVFPLLHGPFGEDGTVQGMLELADIRYVGSGVLASAAGMDKHFMKVVFAGAGLPVGPFTVITDAQWRHDPAAARDAVAGLGMPVFVKPARAGSSMGITKVTSMDDLDAAVENARQHDLKVVVEAGIVGREIECGVLEGHDGAPPRTSRVGEIVVRSGHGHDFYDFEAKYLDTDDSVELTCPADVPADIEARIQELAARAFLALGCEGLARVDCFYTERGDVLINEINTMPGFTPYSMYPQMWLASGLTYPELIDELITLALERPVGLR